MNRQALLIAGACAALAACSSTLPIATGRTLGAELLLRAADPRRSEYGIGLVNMETTSAYLLPLAGGAPTVGWITGADGAVWTQVAGQLARGANADALGADVMRYVVTESSCKGLDEAVALFHEAFAASRAEAREETPALPAAGEAETGAGTIVPRYVIQYAQGDALLRMTLQRDDATALAEASTGLDNLVNRCGAVDGFRDRIQ